MYSVIYIHYNYITKAGLRQGNMQLHKHFFVMLLFKMVILLISFQLTVRSETDEENQDVYNGDLSSLCQCQEVHDEL